MPLLLLIVLTLAPATARADSVAVAVHGKPGPAGHRSVAIQWGVSEPSGRDLQDVSISLPPGTGVRLGGSAVCRGTLDTLVKRGTKACTSAARIGFAEATVQVMTESGTTGDIVDVDVATKQRFSVFRRAQGYALVAQKSLAGYDGREFPVFTLRVADQRRLVFEYEFGRDAGNYFRPTRMLLALPGRVIRPPRRCDRPVEGRVRFDGGQQRKLRGKMGCV